MIGKISRIPYGFLENTEIQDALERVSKDPEEVLNGVLESGLRGRNSGEPRRGK